MGNSNNIPKNLTVDYNQWQKIGQTPMFDIMKSNAGEQAQLYHYILDDTRDEKKQLQIYQMRSKPNTNLINVKGVEQVHQGYGFCGDKKLIKVLTQRIPKTLSDTKQLSFQQSAIVLYHSLKGFKQIHDDFGQTVQVQPNMIGFTKNGQIKVWFQQNFGMNYSLNDKTSKLNASQKQRIMVESLFKTVQSRCQNGSFKQPFRSNLYNNLNFKDAQNFLRESKVIPDNTLNQNFIKTKLDNQRIQTHQQLNQNKISSSVTRPLLANTQNNYPNVSNQTFTQPISNQTSYQPLINQTYNQTVTNPPLTNLYNPSVYNANSANRVTLNSSFKNTQPGNTRVSFNYLPVDPKRQTLQNVNQSISYKQ